MMTIPRITYRRALPRKRTRVAPGIGIIAAALFSEIVVAENLPANYQARYTLYRSGLVLGEVTHTMRSLGQERFVLESQMRTTGLISWLRKEKITEHSEWTYEQNGIRPLQYDFKRTGSKDKSAQVIFDWKQNSALKKNGAAQTITLTPTTYDNLSYQLAIMHDLLNNRRALDYQVIGERKVSHYKFTVVGEETIDTALGKLKTLKLQRGNDRRLTTIWCAPKFSYLPVQIEQNDEKEGHLQLRIDTASGFDK